MPVDWILPVPQSVPVDRAHVHDGSLQQVNSACQEHSTPYWPLHVTEELTDAAAFAARMPPRPSSQVDPTQPVGPCKKACTLM